MKHLKMVKKFLTLLIVGTVLVGTMLVVNAGSCNHGGQDSTFETYKTITINCVSTGSHPCYVGGELTSCEMYRYKMLNYQHCTRCGEEGQSYYSYGPELHQYNH